MAGRKTPAAKDFAAEATHELAQLRKALREAHAELAQLRGQQARIIMMFPSYSRATTFIAMKERER